MKWHRWILPPSSVRELEHPLPPGGSVSPLGTEEVLSAARLQDVLLADSELGDVQPTHQAP